MACSTESLNRWLFAKNKLKQYWKAAKWQQLNPIICVYNIFKFTTTTNIHSLHTNFILHLYPPYDILPALKTLLYCWHGPATPQTSATRSRSRAACASAFYMQKTLAQLFSFRSFACLYLILKKRLYMYIVVNTRQQQWSHATQLLPLTRFHTLFTYNTILWRIMVSLFLKHLSERTKPTVEGYASVNIYTCL